MDGRLSARKLGLLVVVPVLGAALGAVLVTRSPRIQPEAQARTLPAAGPTEAPETEAAAGPALAQVRAGMLLGVLSALDQATTPEFAVTIVDHKAGTTYSYDGDQAFESASVVKVDILATMLLEARREGHPLTEAQQDLAGVMIRQSDNDAASTLWDEIGDAQGLQVANRAFGLTATDPGQDGYWGLTTTTTNDQARLLDEVASPTGPLGPANALLDLMGQVESDQSWGVSAAARVGESTILKNGWLSLDDDGGLWAVNSIGRITGDGTDVTIAVMSDGNPDLDDGIALVEKVALITRTELAY
jgi:hypothetical protein